MNRKPVSIGTFQALVDAEMKLAAWDSANKLATGLQRDKVVAKLTQLLLIRN